MKTPIYSGIFQTDFEAAGYRITGLPLPSAGNEAATKGYVDIHAGGGGGGSNPILTVNVKDVPYSAAGDGVTDDSAAIQSAINAVAAFGGGTIYFPRGIYLCNGAFDSTANSILTIPFRSFASLGECIPMAFLGETPVTGTACAIIKSTKTGTGTVPAVLSAGPSYGGAFLNNSQVNFSMIYMNNLEFRLSGDPTLGAVRLETACWASLEDLEITAGDANTEPTHGTIGIWMPSSGNGGRSFCSRIRVWGFDTAFRVGEHFRAPDIFPYRCKTAIEFLACNNGPSWVNMTTFQCVNDVKFGGFHAVQMLLDTEHAQPASGWFSPSTSIVDPSNYGHGEIKYGICLSNVGAVAGPLTVSGGNYLTFTDYYTGITTLAPSGYLSGTLYIGTDARLVAVSGGVKLEVRNTGTGVWVEATRYTNP